MAVHEGKRATGNAGIACLLRHSPGRRLKGLAKSGLPLGPACGPSGRCRTFLANRRRWLTAQGEPGRPAGLAKAI
jgi:hypothetical protein